MIAYTSHDGNKWVKDVFFKKKKKVYSFFVHKAFPLQVNPYLFFTSQLSIFKYFCEQNNNKILRAFFLKRKGNALKKLIFYS
jgi:hypothetical protein